MSAKGRGSVSRAAGEQPVEAAESVQSRAFFGAHGRDHATWHVLIGREDEY